MVGSVGTVWWLYLSISASKGGGVKEGVLHSYQPVVFLVSDSSSMLQYNNVTIDNTARYAGTLRR